ncbi:peptidoglycan/xylan/chitin deacetylase (PgdA/CDA1 family) [Pedobacter sp. AK017]|uniref:glycoside hydrolase family 9 protein n=1 Tax=Pedobacter sp. AK017 TaxID=2723073 RepID=UPI00160872A1|nr:glycoside hydrolase family 9 protein [Pedobacter sp. AK017]MBB5438286.1 peptidoglycan/xylan/chitin deacetylase (PgdA/CDA1 family) [Pedobacter sp. AK017]
MHKYMVRYIRKMSLFFSFCFLLYTSQAAESSGAWIRINQLGYLPKGIKVAVWVGKQGTAAETFQVLEAKTSALVFRGKTSAAYGAYGPFNQSYRLNFSAFTKPGHYYIQCGEVRSPVFRLADNIYEGTADFSLRYMRQQRSGFNPFLKDSCHTKDGFTMYGPMRDSTHIDVSGGWHDATDYLQYVTTSANATYHLLAAYRDFPEVFSDRHQANGLEGSNGTADVLDEAKWGLNWLLKMHPKKNWMFNQLADDRDHAGMRLPNKDLVDYGMGKGNARVVYFANGEPQGLGKYKNRSTGLASTAGKFSSAFALAASVYQKTDPGLAKLFREKSLSAYSLGLTRPGVSQTAPNREPYFYEEDNWVDDMELASAALYRLTGGQQYLKQSLQYSLAEQVTPWMGADTARHYQWYPFHNFGHAELAAATDGKTKAALIGYYRQGIEKVLGKAKQNVFYRGVPFIWCSNNLTTSFAIQCALYRKLSGDEQYAELEQACIDWLFGCNPWGKCMVYGMPAMGDTPGDPHSSLSYLYHYPLDGGLVDGPVYGSIFKHLRGLTLSKPDAYAEFQSDLVVYHDDKGDYSTNEPTMDGTASLVYLLAGKASEARHSITFPESHGAIIRGDTSSKKLALVFTGDEFGDGAAFIANALKQEQVHGSFFLTGNFYRNKDFKKVIAQLKQDGNYLGSHSDRHLLYCDWGKRDSLLVTKAQFEKDIAAGYLELKKFGIEKNQAPYFLPPYEWYNDTIASWTRGLDLHLVNFTPGTRSNADYTYPEMGAKYINSETVQQSILNYEQKDKNGLNGFILLVHIGTDPRRKDKFYSRLPRLIPALKSKGYQFVRIDELLKQEPAGIPAAYLKDSLPALVAKCKNLLDHAYMAQTLIAETDTLPGWEGLPVKLYAYKTGKDLYTGQPKTGKVYLLNPSAEKLATWIMTTCWEVKKSVEAKYINKVFETIRGQSGAQFPVKGVVYEDQYTRNFQEPYIFKDGVTVYVADSTMFPRDKTCTPAQLDFYLRIENKDLKAQTGRYGRIISTTREMYLANGGTADVGDAEHRKIKWLDIVKDLYKKAWRSDKNELMIAWARQNL